MTGATHERPAKKTEIGLVLQGGGALGAYEYGGILALFDWMDQAEAAGKSVTLRAVTGVSIGAINAACTVGAKSRAAARRQLADLWDDFAVNARFLSGDASLFGVPHFYRLRFDLLLIPTWTYLYDTHPLLDTLKDHVDFAELNQSKTVFAITAVDVKNGTLKRFGNQSIGQIERVTLEPKHILASGSLAPQFPWTEISNHSEPHYYWDGGLVDNTPLGDAIDAFTSENDADPVLVVMNLFPLRACRPKSFAQVNDRVNQLRFGNRLRQDTKNDERINKLVAAIEDLLPHAPADVRRKVQAKVGKDNFKQVKTIQVLLSGDDDYAEPDGFRDFSREGIEQRRAKGYDITLAALRHHFAAKTAAQQGVH